jgi:hypothetical protein
MTLQSSGAISLSNIASEMGGSTPHSLSEYYKGGGLVGNHSNNPNVPTSGTISFSNFYGANNTAPVVANTATMTAGSYAVPGDKYAQTYYGYNSWTQSGYYAFGSASDTTIADSSGTSHDIIGVYESYSTLATYGYFRTRGNFNGTTLQNAFGYTSVKWGGTTIMSGGNTITGVYQSASGGSTYWLLNYDARPTGSNQTVDFTN